MTSARWRALRITEVGEFMSGARRSALERKKERLSALLHLAAQDTEAAMLLAAHNNHYAAYHCQQAAEKLMRVLLIHHDIEPGLDHHLDVLVGKLPDDEPWKAKLAPLHKYTPYATTYRYATSSGRVPTSPDASGVASDAAHIAALIADARRQLVGR
jgi:HEPN domain-containing protein